MPEQDKAIDNELQELAEADTDVTETLRPIFSPAPGSDLEVLLGNYDNAILARYAVQANLQAAAESAKATNTAVANAKPSRDAALHNEINTAKTVNETVRKQANKETEKEHRNGENESWTAYAGAWLKGNAGFWFGIKAAETTYQRSVSAARTSFDATSFQAAENYVQRELTYQEQFEQAVQDNRNGIIPGAVGGVFRDGREWAASKVRALTQWNTKCAERAASFCTGNNPYVVGAASFGGNFIQNAAEIPLGVVEAEKTIERTIIDVGEAIDVGNEHGFVVGVDHMIGLRQFAEAWFGVDIMTTEKVDVMNKLAEGSGRFGGTAGTLAGGIWGVRAIGKNIGSKISNIAKHADDVTAAKPASQISQYDIELKQVQTKLAGQIEEMWRFGMDPKNGFKPFEYQTSVRMRERGIRLKGRDLSGDAEWFDVNGKTYDAVGGDLPMYNMEQFKTSIINHTRKANDYTVVDILN